MRYRSPPLHSEVARDHRHVANDSPIRTMAFQDPVHNGPPFVNHCVITNQLPILGITNDGGTGGSSGPLAAALLLGIASCRSRTWSGRSGGILQARSVQTRHFLQQKTLEAKWLCNGNIRQCDIVVVVVVVVVVVGAWLRGCYGCCCCSCCCSSWRKTFIFLVCVRRSVRASMRVCAWTCHIIIFHMVFLWIYRFIVAWLPISQLGLEYPTN